MSNRRGAVIPISSFVSSIREGSTFDVLLMSLHTARRLLMTQIDDATVLHVRRESVTEAAAALRSRDLISYSRGTIRILNRKGLLSASCSCYRQIEFLHAA